MTNARYAMDTRATAAVLGLLLALGGASACRRAGPERTAGRDDPLAPDPEWLFPVGDHDACGFIDAAGVEVIPRTLRAACDGPGYSRNGLIPVAFDDGYGYVDGKGRPALSARYEAVGWFTEGLAPVKRGGRWGFIDARGREVVAPRFANAQPFSDGLAAVLIQDKKLWAYIDRTGRAVIAAAYFEAGSFTDGVARVRGPQGEAFIDRRGRVVLTDASLGGGQLPVSFSDGLAGVSSDALAGVSSDVPGKYGCRFIDTGGRAILEVPGCLFAFDFHEGLAAFGRSDWNKALMAGDETPLQELLGYVDRRGTIVVKPRFSHAGEFAGGLAPVTVSKEGTGFIDRQGTFIIGPRFRGARPFAHGLAKVLTVEGEPGYIDRRGTLVWPRPVPPVAGQELEYRELASSGGSRAFDERDVRVLGNEQEFVAAWKNAARSRVRPVDPPPTDFVRKVYVLIALGTFPIDGHDVCVREVVEEGGRIVIRYDELRPIEMGRLCTYGKVYVSPFVLLEIESRPKPVVFEQRLLASCI